MKKILMLLFSFLISGITLSTFGCAIGDEAEDSIEVWRLTQDTWLCDADSVAYGDCTSADLGEYITEDLSTISIGYDFDDDGTVEYINTSLYIEMKNNKIRSYYKIDIDDGGSDTSTLLKYYTEGIFYCSLDDWSYQLNGNTLTLTIDGETGDIIYSQNGNKMSWAYSSVTNQKTNFVKTTISSPTEDCEMFSDEKKSTDSSINHSFKKRALQKNSALKKLNRILKR